MNRTAHLREQLHVLDGALKRELRDLQQNRLPPVVGSPLHFAGEPRHESVIIRQPVVNCPAWQVQMAADTADGLRRLWVQPRLQISLLLARGAERRGPLTGMAAAPWVLARSHTVIAEAKSAPPNVQAAAGAEADIAHGVTPAKPVQR